MYTTYVYFENLIDIFHDSNERSRVTKGIIEAERITNSLFWKGPHRVIYKCYDEKQYGFIVTNYCDITQKFYVNLENTRSFISNHKKFMFHLVGNIF